MITLEVTKLQFVAMPNSGKNLDTAQIPANNIIGTNALYRDGLAGNSDAVLHPGVADITFGDPQFPGNLAYGIQSRHAPFFNGQVDMFTEPGWFISRNFRYAEVVRRFLDGAPGAGYVGGQ